MFRVTSSADPYVAFGWIILLVLAAMVTLFAIGPLVVAVIVTLGWLVWRGYDVKTNHDVMHRRELLVLALVPMTTVLLAAYIRQFNPVAEYVTAQGRVLPSLPAYLRGDRPSGEIVWWLAAIAPVSLAIGPLLPLPLLLLRRERARGAEGLGIPAPVARMAQTGIDHPVGCSGLGYRADGSKVLLCGAEERMHELILGGTGSGKTQFLLTRIEAYKGRRAAVIVFEGKPSADIEEHMLAIEPSTQLWKLNGRLRLNPFTGSASELGGKGVDASGIENEFYRAVANRYFQLLGRVLDVSRVARSPSTIKRLLMPVELERDADELMRRFRMEGDLELEDEMLSIATYAKNLQTDRDRLPGVTGLADRFSHLVEGDARFSLGEAVDAIELDKVIRSKQWVHIALPGDQYPLQVETIAAWLLRDLALVSARLVAEGWGRDHVAVVVIDELGAMGLGARHVVDLFARAREAGLVLIVALQSMADVRAISQSLPAQIEQNTPVKILLRQDGEEADRAERGLGWDEVPDVTRSTESSTGSERVSVRLTQKPRVLRSLLTALGPGDAILKVAATMNSRERIERFRVALPRRQASTGGGS